MLQRYKYTNWHGKWAVRTSQQIRWRKRVGVEPTIRPAKDRIAGFEGRGDHRTPFASATSIAGGKIAPNLTATRVQARCATTSAVCVRISAATKSCSFGFVHTS